MFDPRDLTQLRDHGLDPDDAARQLERLGGPPPRARLVRPCTVGDGIEQLDDDSFARALEYHAQAAGAGRVACFVPASGAATRLVASLVDARRRGVGRDGLRVAAVAGDALAAEALRILDGLEQMPFSAAIAEGAGIGGDRLEAVLSAVLDPDGLNLDGRPKGLVPFHVYDDGVRTAFEEQLIAAIELARDSDGRCRLHLTVSAGHLEAFRAALADARERLPALGAVQLDVELSCQSPSTDTLALDAAGRPLRDAGGRLILRPGGHGALLDNLARAGGELVTIRNIDNVQRDDRARGEWRRALVGRAVELQGQAFDAIRALRRPDVDAAALESAARLARGFGRADVDVSRDREILLAALDRPIRVCGVVRNTDEPGGGPFWAGDRHGGVTPQIVEGAQVDSHDREQQAIASAATHFNPVDLVCGLSDVDGRRHDTDAFVDASQSIVTRKLVAGSEITVLERPGLWNGAMAGWLTRFVEIPLETFTPVKTLADLLRPEHQPPAG